VRYSRGRLLLRVVLLLVGGGFMGWRALETWRAARAAPGPGGSLLGERIALVMALVALLAILTAVAALLQLRPRERRHSLHLPGGPPTGGPPGPGSPPSGGP
jgi:hypothetical protein